MKYLKKSIFILAVFAALFLSACGRSDVTLTVLDDGSFKADISYSITKSLMGSPEVQEQVKSLITDSLEQNSIEYTESENDDYVIISVERSFADIDELTSAAAWQGISMVPKLSKEQATDSLWVRYEDGRLKIDGTLDANAFGAEELVSANGGVSDSFGGSLTIVLPDSADSFGDADTAPASADASDRDETEERYLYCWSGTSADSKTVSLISGELEAAKIAAQNEAASKKSADESESSKIKSSTAIGITVLAVILIAAAGVLIIKSKKKNKLSGEDK